MTDFVISDRIGQFKFFCLLNLLTKWVSRYMIGANRTKGNAEDVCEHGFNTEYQHVLSNALLPGISYGWGVRLCV